MNCQKLCCGGRSPTGPSQKRDLDYVVEAMIEWWGQRCRIPAPGTGCAVCDAWAQYDGLKLPKVDYSLGTMTEKDVTTFWYERAKMLVKRANKSEKKLARLGQLLEEERRYDDDATAHSQLKGYIWMSAIEEIIK